MLWQLSGPATPEAVAVARDYYERKYGRKPGRVLMHPDQPVQAAVNVTLQEGITKGCLLLEHRVD